MNLLILCGAISTMSAWGTTPWPMLREGATTSFSKRGDVTLMKVRGPDGQPIGTVEVFPNGKRVFLAPNGKILDQIQVNPHAIPPWRPIAPGVRLKWP